MVKPVYDQLLAKTRQPEPIGEEAVWYRGWEVSWSQQADYWGAEAWTAYKGGCDLDAPQVMARTFELCLDEVDSAEDDA